jgi:hypothetical protein
VRELGRLLAATQLEAEPADQPAMMAGVEAGNEIGGGVAQASSPGNPDGPSRRAKRSFGPSIKTCSHYHI